MLECERERGVLRAAVLLHEFRAQVCVCVCVCVCVVCVCVGALHCG